MGHADDEEGDGKSGTKKGGCEAGARVEVRRHGWEKGRVCLVLLEAHCLGTGRGSMFASPFKSFQRFWQTRPWLR